MNAMTEAMNGGMEMQGMQAQEMTLQELMQQEETALQPPDVDTAPEEEVAQGETAQPGAEQAADEHGEDESQKGGEEGAGGALPDAEACRRELAQLALNGFTMEELRAFSEDEQVQAAIAGGMSIARAATEYLRRSAAAAARERPARKRAVPNVRTAAGGDRREENSMEQMSDEQFRAFSRRAMEATLAGRRIRLD